MSEKGNYLNAEEMAKIISQFPAGDIFWDISVKGFTICEYDDLFMYIADSIRRILRTNVNNAPTREDWVTSGKYRPEFEPMDVYEKCMCGCKNQMTAKILLKFKMAEFISSRIKQNGELSHHELMSMIVISELGDVKVQENIIEFYYTAMKFCSHETRQKITDAFENESIIPLSHLEKENREYISETTKIIDVHISPCPDIGDDANINCGNLQSGSCVLRD